MSLGRTGIGLALVGLVAAGSPSAAGQEKNQQRDSLRDLDGVEVIVEDLHPALAEWDLTAERVERAVEQQLRAAGVRALVGEDRKGTPGAPFLYVAITTNRSGQAFGFGVRVAVGQALWSFVTGELVWGETWDTSGVGLANADHVAESIRGTLRAYVNRFIADWQAVHVAEAAAAPAPPDPE